MERRETVQGGTEKKKEKKKKREGLSEGRLKEERSKKGEDCGRETV